MMKTNRLEVIANRLRSRRKLDLIFACLIASSVLLGTSAIAAGAFDVSAHVGQR